MATRKQYIIKAIIETHGAADRRVAGKETSKIYNARCKGWPTTRRRASPATGSPIEEALELTDMTPTESATALGAAVLAEAGPVPTGNGELFIDSNEAPAASESHQQRCEPTARSSHRRRTCAWSAASAKWGRHS